MTLQVAARPGSRGVQQPSLELIPDYVSSAGAEAVELAAIAGLDLDPWQQYVLGHALGETKDGRWAAFEVGIVVPRQNGKGAILEARELAGLFLLGERLLIHSAHQFDTSLEHFRRLESLIQNTPELHRRVKPKGYKHSHGEEGIELRSGQRIRFRTRTKGGGRGFSADFVGFDEAMILPEAMMGAILPILSARPNPQVWYTGSAVDQYIHDDGVVLARVRKRGLSGDTDGSLAYFEWTLDEADTPSAVADDTASDEDVWARTNPGLGIRIDSEHVANEREALDHRTFVVERLNVGDWPDPEVGGSSVLDLAVWDELRDPDSAPQDPVAFAFDVMPDRSSAAIAAAGKRDDGQAHVEIVDRRRGTGWLTARLVELVRRHDAIGVCCDGAGPAGSLMHELQEAGIEVTAVTAAEHAKACGLIFDAVDQRALRHLGSDELRAAIKGASRRPLGDAWAWSRKHSTVDISPLVAATLALWLSQTAPSQEFPMAALV
jgi:hypothetical protein